MSWILYTLIYGVLKGARDIVKKESLKISPAVEVLFFYTLFSFILCIPMSQGIADIDMKYMPFIVLKSFVIFIAWILSFHAIKNLPISIYGILDLSRVINATLIGFFILHETITRNQIIGMVLVAAGLLLLKRGKQKENVKVFMVVIALISCVLNSVSGFLDKVLTKFVTPSQLQFYYMMYLTLFYLIYFIVAGIIESRKGRTVAGNAGADSVDLSHGEGSEVKKAGVLGGSMNIKRAVTNYWIWIIAILFVIADKSLFIANANPASKISVMTLIKQAGVIVVILAGKFIYKEKNIGHKFICAGIIIAGIVIAVC